MVKIPNRLEDLYPAGAVEKVLAALHQPELTGKVRSALGKVGLGEIHPLEQMQEAWKQARSWIESLGTDTEIGSESSLINATGQLWHEAIEQTPISGSVARAYAAAAATFQNESVLRHKCDGTATSIFGSAHVCWLSHTWLAIRALVGNRQVLVAKTDGVRIAGLGNVGEILQGLATIEVGAANGCTLQDWHDAFSMAKQKDGKVADAPGERCCILLVSPSGHSLKESAAHREQALAFAAQSQVAVFELLADATLNEKLGKTFGFSSVTKTLETGTDVAIAPLNLLLGAPTGAILVGDSQIVQPLIKQSRREGLALTGASLMAANLALQLAQVIDETEAGPMSQLLRNQDNLENRAQRMAVQLDGNGIVSSARVIERQVPLGPGVWNRFKLSNWAIELTPIEAADELQNQLLKGNSVPAESGLSDTDTWTLPIAVERVSERLIVDLRFIDPQDDHRIVLALSPIVASREAGAAD